jgi:hypothetical protein
MKFLYQSRIYMIKLLHINLRQKLYWSKNCFENFGSSYEDRSEDVDQCDKYHCQRKYNSMTLTWRQDYLELSRMNVALNCYIWVVRIDIDHYCLWSGMFYGCFHWARNKSTSTFKKLLCTFDGKIRTYKIEFSCHIFPNLVTKIWKIHKIKPDGVMRTSIESQRGLITEKISTCKFSVYFNETVAQTSRKNINQGIV